MRCQIQKYFCMIFFSYSCNSFAREEDFLNILLNIVSLWVYMFASNYLVSYRKNCLKTITFWTWSISDVTIVLSRSNASLLVLQGARDSFDNNNCYWIKRYTSCAAFTVSWKLSPLPYVREWDDLIVMRLTSPGSVVLIRYTDLVAYQINIRHLLQARVPVHIIFINNRKLV